MEHDKYAIYIIWLVAIVGVVSLVAVFTGVNSQTVTGQAFGTCSDSDGGENAYKTGITTGFINGGYHTVEDYCYDGTSIVEACDSCHLYEFYCDGRFVKSRLYWSGSYNSYYNNIYCENGRFVEGVFDDEEDESNSGDFVFGLTDFEYIVDTRTHFD